MAAVVGVGNGCLRRMVGGRGLRKGGREEGKKKGKRENIEITWREEEEKYREVRGREGVRQGSKVEENRKEELHAGGQDSS